MSSWSKIGDTWSARYSYKKPDGKYAQKRFSFPGLNKRQALNEFARLIVDYEVNANNISLAKLLNIWIEHKKHNLSQRCVIDYKKIIRSFCQTQLSQKQISDITISDMQNYIDSRLSAGVSIKTIKNYFVVLRPAFEYAIMQNLIKVNPCRNTILPVMRKQPIEIIPDDKIIVLLEEINKNFYKLPMLILFNTAMRRSEVCALQWSDINLEDRIITVSKSLYQENKVWHVKPTKSYRIRHIGITEVLYEALKEVYNNKSSDVWVCTNYIGDFLSPRTLYKEYAKIAKRVGVSTKLHNIRHTVITTMIQNNANIKTVSEIAGHANIQMTLDRYTHLNVEDQREALSILDSKYKSK